MTAGIMNTKTETQPQAKDNRSLIVRAYQSVTGNTIDEITAVTLPQHVKSVLFYRHFVGKCRAQWSKN